MGIDGTVVWAAATSGRDALCVQLLACMLARVWNAAEVTSIWVEILENRKLKLCRREDDFLLEIAAIGSLSRAWSPTNMEGNYVNIYRYHESIFSLLCIA
jgi:hypothetical protein